MRLIKAVLKSGSTLVIAITEITKFSLHQRSAEFMDLELVTRIIKSYLLNKQVTQFLKQHNDSGRSAVVLAVDPGQADAVHHGSNHWYSLIKLSLKNE